MELSKLLQELIDPYPSAVELVYGEEGFDPENPKIPEFVAAPDPVEMIYGDDMKMGGIGDGEDEGLMSAMSFGMGMYPPAPILVAGPGGPIPMMVPVVGGPLVPYSLTGP